VFDRSSGVFLSISSLPGPYAIGDFGAGARRFIDILSQAGISWWQILPLNIPGEGDSPYTSVSSRAINPLFISPELLLAEGLVTEQECSKAEFDAPHQVDYARARLLKQQLFERAFSRLSLRYRHECSEFAKASGWIPDFALFMALKEQFGPLSWTKWPLALRRREPEALAAARSQYSARIAYYEFLQYEAARQWQLLKAYAARHGVGLIGDMPIYVSLDSADVWCNPSLFELDEDCTPLRVAGVPPDYFAEDGQLWGNPLYNWSEMEKDGYAWWLGRISHALQLYDALRIDHFRGFSDYYAIPAAAATAREGSWQPGPGMKLFSRVKAQLGDAPIIAEDLGVTDARVTALLEATGFPGMRVMQFAFNGDPDNVHLPHTYTQNCIAYSGTHDNNTTLGWLWEAGHDERRQALEYCDCEQDWGAGGTNSASCRSVMRTLLMSAAGVVIVPLQDILGYGADTRMNVPGVPSGNWALRFTQRELSAITGSPFAKMISLYGRSRR